MKVKRDMRIKRTTEKEVELVARYAYKKFDEGICPPDGGFYDYIKLYDLYQHDFTVEEAISTLVHLVSRYKRRNCDTCMYKHAQHRDAPNNRHGISGRLCGCIFQGDYTPHDPFLAWSCNAPMEGNDIVNPDSELVKMFPGVYDQPDNFQML